MMRRRKRDLRRRIRTELAGIPEVELSQRSARIAERLVALDEWRNAPLILAFNSMPGEVDTRFFLNEAFTVGKRVALPRIVGEEMEFAEWRGPDDPLEVGRYGVREPRREAAVIDLQGRKEQSDPQSPTGPDSGRGPRNFRANSALLVAPGLAFGRDGSRLGRAGGFYDRFLSSHRRELVTVGICLERFLFDAVPTQEHDQAVDFVITENQTVAVGPL